jgi:hypothetical protein
MAKDAMNVPPSRFGLVVGAVTLFIAVLFLSAVSFLWALLACDADEPGALNQCWLEDHSHSPPSTHPAAFVIFPIPLVVALVGSWIAIQRRNRAMLKSVAIASPLLVVAGWFIGALLLPDNLKPLVSAATR